MSVTTHAFAHLVGSLSAVILVAVCLLDPYRWAPIHNVWAAIMIGALVALGGSIFAVRKGTRWWLILTFCSAAVVVLDMVALGG
jgi:hypothetical protein